MKLFKKNNKLFNLFLSLIVVFLLFLIFFFTNRFLFFFREDFVSSDDKEIPANIFLIWLGSPIPELVQENFNLIKEKNKNFNCLIYNDEMAEKFLKENFDENVCSAFTTLVPQAYKADLLRYCLLYKYGGIYIDTKMSPVNGFTFDELLDKEYFAKDIETSGNGVYNAVLVCKKNNNVMKMAIDKIIENIKNDFYGNSSLLPTGPLLLKSFFKENEIRDFDLKLTDSYSSNNAFVAKKNKNILKVDMNIYSKRNNKKHYTELWYSKQIYKK